MKNLLVAQSGGPTAVINASLAGVIAEAFQNGDKTDRVLGCVYGVEGIENENFVSLDAFRSREKLQMLKQTPASYLGSCRKKLPKVSDNIEYYQKIFEILHRNNIGYFLTIGGNDSMDTVDKLSTYAEMVGEDIRIVGVPKTIDNDLGLTDHTPGYGSAAKFVANSLRQLWCDTDVYDMPSVIVAEIMGRNAGWLTAAAALAGDAVDMICLPEHAFDMEDFLQKTEQRSKEKQTLIIALSEGIKDKDGNYIDLAGVQKDRFGHAALGGVSRAVQYQIREELGLKTRAIEFSTLQRCAAYSLSECDLEEAYLAGQTAVRYACVQNLSGVMPGFVRKSDAPYKIELQPMPVVKIANLEKPVPAEMITPDGYGVTDAFLRYAKPLIQGEPELIYQNGVLQFVSR